MPITQPDGLSKWHILTFISPGSKIESARKAIDRFNRAESSNLRIFAPKYTVCETKDGKVTMRNRPLTFFYVFVHGPFADIKRLCGKAIGFAFLLDRAGAERYATLSDEEMSRFRMIARAYENSLPYFSLDDIDLSEGDLVEVINGDFPGLIGHYMPRPRSKNGNVMIRVDQGFATAAFNIRADDVRVLKFAPGSGREYDAIDKFIPILLSALRHFHLDIPLSRSETARLTVFCRRMESVNLSNPKLQPKLAAMLSAAFLLIGSQESYARFLKLYHRTASNITNPWTRALTQLIASIIHSDRNLFHESHETISGLPHSTKTQVQLLQEYDFHSPLFR